MLAYVDATATPSVLRVEHYRASTEQWQQHSLASAATPIFELELALANGKAVLKYKNNAYSSVPEGSFLHRYDGSQWQASERVSDHSIRVDLADNGDILLAESRYSHSGTVGGQTLYYSDLYARRYTETAGWSELVIVAEDIVEAHTDIVAGTDRLDLQWWGFQQAVQTSSFDQTTTLPGTQFYAVHTDHLGTPRLLTNRVGTKVWEAHYEAFGTAVVNGNPDGDAVTINYPIRFPGQYYDAESGLHYNYFRDYDPGIGRYITRDPIGLDGGPNTYAYVDGNPLNFSDPAGLAKKRKKLPGPQSEILPCDADANAVCAAKCGCSENVARCRLKISHKFRVQKIDSDPVYDETREVLCECKGDDVPETSPEEEEAPEKPFTLPPAPPFVFPPMPGRRPGSTPLEQLLR
jgi:RHS repeat-associated protein